MRELLAVSTALITSVATLSLADPPTPADTASQTVYLPAAVNTAGLFGAHFRTRVFIRLDNFSPIDLAVVAVTPNGFLTATLSPSHDYASDNILDDLFHYTGGAALSFTLASDSINRGTFVMRAEVYTDGPLGEVSTQLPLLTAENVVVSQPDPERALSVSVGLRSDSGHRLNVGCSNFGQDAASVSAILYSPVDGSFWAYTFSLLPGQWSQTVVDNTSMPPPARLYFISSDTVTNTVTLPIFCYAVIVSNTSNQGTMVPAIRTTPSPF